MCYSAQVYAAYQRYVREWGADIDIVAFVELYGPHPDGARVRTSKAMDTAFSALSPEIAQRVDESNRAQRTTLEREIFTQRKRLADAERTLAVKVTKKAQNDQRIATDKVSKALVRIADITRSEPKPKDSRIFPGHYAPVMVGAENGRKLLLPMRYQCRPAGKPAHYDVKYPGTYNARRDNLEGFWKGQFGHTHGVMLVDRFYENVERLDDDGTPRNVVLEFAPADGRAMIVACLWSRWTDPKGQAPDLLSFAAITDEPPPEVAAAGHDRCIIPIRAEHVDAWLHPNPANLPALYAILDDRERPYYEHRLAA